MCVTTKCFPECLFWPNTPGVDLFEQVFFMWWFYVVNWKTYSYFEKIFKGSHYKAS